MKKFYYLLLVLLIVSQPSAQTEKMSSEQMKPALLVIDIQNEYLRYMSEDDKKLALEMINGAIWLFRQHNLPVIRVYHTDPQFGPKPDSEPFEYPASVIVTKDDPRVIKNYPSAFKKTELEKILREKGCNTVFLCGLSAVGCVLASYYSANDLDFNTFMVKDALLSQNSTYTNFIEEICNSVNFTTLKLLLQYTQK
jgi:nicotinamidase-related amidase